MSISSTSHPFTDEETEAQKGRSWPPSRPAWRWWSWDWNPELWVPSYFLELVFVLFSCFHFQAEHQFRDGCIKPSSLPAQPDPSPTLQSPASPSARPQHGACVEVECVSGRGSGAGSGLPEAQVGPALPADVLRKEVGGPLRGGWASDPGRSTAGPRSHGWK